MTLRKVRAYCFIALAIMLFCACQETEHIQLSDGEEVPVEVVMSARGSEIANLSHTGREGIASLRIVVFRHNVLSLPGVPSWTCEYNRRINHTDATTWESPSSETGGIGADLTYDTIEGVFQLGTLSTGEKRIYVIANEDSYYDESDNPLTKFTTYDGFVAIASETAKELITSDISPTIPATMSAREATDTADPLLMSGSITTVVTTSNLPRKGTFTVPSSIELVRACARVEADIICAEDFTDTWKVTKVEMTNCTNKVSLFGGKVDGVSYFMDGTDTSNKKTYTLFTAADPVVTIPSSGDAQSLFKDIYVYENIISSVSTSNATNVPADVATKITLTLEQVTNAGGIDPTNTGAGPKNVTFYVGNGAKAEESGTGGVVSAVSSLSVPRATTTDNDYNVYRNYHYILNIKVKSATGGGVDPASVNSTTILPRGTSSDDIQLDVTVTRVEEK